MTRKRLPRAIRQPVDELGRLAAVPAGHEEPAADEAALAISSIPAANDTLPAASVDSRAAKRRALAQKIVERHKTYAAMGGLLPLPIVNIATVTAVIMRMIKQLSELYQMPFERDRTRSIVIGLIGGAVPSGFGFATTSTLALLIPASGFVGLAVSAATAAALTRGIGLVFADSFEQSAAFHPT
jgi:uncharacterized protein (DUF697 family)